MTLLCFLAKIAETLQKVIVFSPERGKETEPWFWHIPQLLIFFDFGHLQGETCGQSWTNSANFGSVSFSEKFESFKFFFKQCFCLLEYYLWWEFRQYWSMGPKISQKGSFHCSATLLKLTLLHRCFSRFSNCTNGTKSQRTTY